MTGVLIGGGGASDPQTGDDSQGMSFEGTARSFSQQNDLVEMAALPIDELSVHNHSYGPVVGWSQIPVGSYRLVFWQDDLAVSTTEAGRFGRYEDIARDTDDVVRTTPYTLPVWAAGNDTGDSLASFTNSASLLTVVRNGVSQGDNYYVAFFNGDVVFHNGTRFWRLTQGSLSNSAPVFTVGAGQNPTSLAGTPAPDGGTAQQDSVPDGYPLAKNVLTVGAIDSSNIVAPFSARGPVDDGRIKPEVVAPGVDIFAPSGASDSAYASVSGTSFSAPAVSGSINLLAEFQNQQWGAMEPLRASTYRALVVQTADDLGARGPDYTYGYGLPQFDTAASLIELNSPLVGQRTFIKEIILEDGQEADFTIRTAGVSAVKVTAAWTDPSGAPVPQTLDPSQPALVNNLDLRVLQQDTAGNTVRTFTPFYLDPNNPSARARRGQNDVDNLEQVVTRNAGQNEIWRVTVKPKAGTSIVGDNGVVGEPQVVSLVLSGVVDRDIPFAVTDQTFDFSGGQVTATLTWGSHAGQFYMLESSTNLQTWTPASGVFNAREDETTAAADPFPATGSRFFRVVTVSPGFLTL